MELVENKTIKEIYGLLEKHGMSPTALAICLNIVPGRLCDILKGRRRVTANTDLRLCKFFKKKNGYFLKLQIEYDLETAEANMSEILDKIKTFDEIPAAHKY
jgi:addiction module HigA family antidote